MIDAVKLHFFHRRRRIVGDALATRNVAVIFFHLRVERTPQRNWMWFFNCRRDPLDRLSLPEKASAALKTSGTSLKRRVTERRITISETTKSSIAERVFPRRTRDLTSFLTEIRFSPINKSAARPIVRSFARKIYVETWRYLPRSKCRMQTNSMRCAGWINFASGVHSTRNVSAWFVAKSLPAGKSRWLVERMETDRCGLVVLRNVAIQFRWIGYCLQMKSSPRWKGWLRKNAKLRRRAQSSLATEDLSTLTKRRKASQRDCANSRSISRGLLSAVPSNYCGPRPGWPADFVPRWVVARIG